MCEDKDYKCPFNKLSLVKFVSPGEEWVNGYPFINDQILLFMGEIEQMPGHCVVADRAGKVHWGFHTENFVKPTEDEI
jgi:hypothetical protein